MWTPKDDDELKNKLKYDIIDWYKKWYIGPEETLTRHLELFDKYYDPRLFDDKKELSNHVREFLIFIQNEREKSEVD